MKPAMPASALSAGEASLEEGPSLAIPGSRPPSPMVPASGSRRLLSRERELQAQCLMTVFSGTDVVGRDLDSGHVSASASREASSERRASSPACREALVRTRGVLTAARTRVLELEGQLEKIQQEKSEQDVTVRELQDQVRRLQDQMLERVIDARRSPRKLGEMTTPSSVRRRNCRSGWMGQEDICSDWCSPLPLASPLQVCEAAVARLEGLFERSSILRSHLLEWRVKALEARRHRSLPQSTTSSSTPYFGEFRAKTCFAWGCSETDTLGSATDTPLAEQQAPRQQNGATGRRRRRVCPGALRLVAATATRCETATVLLVWTAWWSLWRGRHLKARTAIEAPADVGSPGDESRRQCPGYSDTLLSLCFWAWSKRASDECRSRLRGLVRQLNGAVDFRCKLVAIGRRCLSSAAAHRVNDALQVAWTRWRDKVEVNAYFRRISAEHASRCERLRVAATALVQASSHRQQSALTVHSWLAWRSFCRCQTLRIRLAESLAPDMVVQRTFFQGWLMATKAAVQDRFRISHASHVRRSSAANSVLIAAWSWCDSDLSRTCLGAWRSCTLLTRQGRLHRRQLLEVLAPQCALVRMCLAVWNRSACDSRMQAWRMEHQQAAAIRCQALDELSTMMARGYEAARSLIFFAWLSWRQLLEERHENGKSSTHVVDSQVALQRLQREALSRLKVSLWRDFELAMAKIAWKAWHMLLAVSGPRFPTEPNEDAQLWLSTSTLSPPRQQTPFKSPLKRAVTRQASINGRPPSAVSTIGTRTSITLTPGASLQSQTPSRLTLEAVQQCSQQQFEDEGNCRSMRHVRSDPSICLKPPSSIPGASHEVTHGTSFTSPAQSRVTSLAGHLTAPLASLSVTAPVSSRSSVSTAASTRADTDASSESNSVRRPSLAYLLEGKSQWSLKQGGPFLGGCGKTPLASTPRDGGPSTSDRSTCCSSTPRSSVGPDIGPPASCTGSSPERQAIGPACQLIETPLPQAKCANARQCEEDVLRTPVGPLVTPSPGGVAGKALYRSASSGARTLLASDLIRPLTRSNSSQFRCQASPPTGIALAAALPLEVGQL